MVIRYVAVVVCLFLAVSGISPLVHAGGPASCEPAPVCGPPQCGQQTNSCALLGGCLGICTNICGALIGCPAMIMNAILAPPRQGGCAPVSCGPPPCPPPTCGPQACVPQCGPQVCAPQTCMPQSCAPVKCKTAPYGSYGPYGAYGPGPTPVSWRGPIYR